LPSGQPTAGSFAAAAPSVVAAATPTEDGTAISTPSQADVIVGDVADNSSLNQLVVPAVALPTRPALIQCDVPNVVHASAVAGTHEATGFRSTLSSIPAVRTPGRLDSSSRLPDLAANRALPVVARLTASTVHDLWAVTPAAVTPNNSGGAVSKTSTLPLGSDTITATYSGDTNFSGSSGTLSKQVNTSMVPAPLGVQAASTSSSASGINDAAIASLLAEWSQDNLDLSDSLSSALSA
jgi:hypothetical protein